MADPAREFMVVFSPSGRRGRFEAGTTVLDAARSLGVDLDSVCGGRAICGRCRVAVTEGRLAKHGIQSSAEHLSAAGEAETGFAARRGLEPGHRLACQAQIHGDLALDVPQASQVHRQVVRKPHEVVDIELDPVVRACLVEVEQPSMDDPRGDLERLHEALEREWGIRAAYVDQRVMRSLQQTLREGRWQVTAAVHNDNELVAVWPGFHDRLFGVAIDVGSTTLAMQLCDLRTGEVRAASGCMNPQIRFGEDLMSRVSWVMLNEDGAPELTRAVREALDDLLGAVTGHAGIDRADVLELSIVGNPIMLHLLLGYDPRELGQAPFALASDGAVSLPARELGIEAHAGAYAYALPCIAGHVGADMAGALLAEKLWARDDITLLVDVGTNAEIVLGGGDRLLAASSPTGPAFEGAQISGGQRAAPGAIERVRVDPESLEPRYRVIGSETWSGEDGFAETLPVAGISGICGSGIIEAVAELFLAGVIDRDGRIGDLRDRSDRVVMDGRTFAYELVRGAQPIRITQNDVRAVQLAKAALYAGSHLLMEKMGVERVDRIRLAGAFGSHIDVKYAMVLGMIPDCDLDRVSSAGNAAGTGARIALLNRAARSEIERRVRNVEKIETAVEPRFQEHFVAAMGIPHGSHPFERLSQHVTLPAVRPRERSRPTRRRRS